MVHDRLGCGPLLLVALPCLAAAAAAAAAAVVVVVVVVGGGGGGGWVGVGGVGVVGGWW